MKGFGEQLQEILSFFNLRYIEVAIAVGYDPSYISKWVRAVAVPASSALPNVCESLTKLIESKCKKRQISEFCAMHDAYQSVDDMEKAFNDPEILSANLYRLISDMLMGAEENKNKTSKRSSVKPEGRPSYAADCDENRYDAIKREIEKLRSNGGMLDMKIVYDLQKTTIADIVFLLDVQNFINQCGFENGKIEILISEESLAKQHSEKVITALLNYIIQPSCVERRFVSCPISSVGMVIVVGGLIYKAECETERGWIFENIIRDPQEVARVLLMIKSYVMPASKSLFSERDITDGMLGEKGGAIYWKITHDMLLSNMNSAYIDPDTAQKLFGDNKEILEAAGIQYRQLVDNLQNGESHRCIIARDAMEDFVFSGKVRACGHQYNMPMESRLKVLQNIEELTLAYPETFKFRIVERAAFSDVKHIPLPSLFGHDNSMRFLSRKCQDERRYCIVTNSLFRRTLMDFVNRLWSNMFVTQSDTMNLLEEYIGYCREFA